MFFLICQKGSLFFNGPRYHEHTLRNVFPKFRAVIEMSMLLKTSRARLCLPRVPPESIDRFTPKDFAAVDIVKALIAPSPYASFFSRSYLNHVRTVDCWARVVQVRHIIPSTRSLWSQAEAYRPIAFSYCCLTAY
jgi:hypothetical protein